MGGDRPARLAAAPLPTPHQPPAVSHAKATAILAQRQFRAARPNLWTQVLTWLGQHLSFGMGSLLGGGWAALAGWSILLLVVAVVAALVVYATRTLRRDPERREAPLRIEVHRSATDWRREAEDFERRGDWKQGLRCRYRALVAELIATHVVLDLPGRTTGEYRGDVGVTLPGAATPFAGASELFERAWYGDRATGPDESHRFEELADEVLAEARRRRPAPPDAGDAGSDRDGELVAL